MKRSTHRFISPALVFFISLYLCARADALSCRGGFISVGATTEEVLYKCGSPADVRNWEDARLIGPPTYDTRFGIYSLVIYVPMEAWTYNFGPGKFMATLTFEKGKLKLIERGRYGY
jgi:hypothetical protein